MTSNPTPTPAEARATKATEARLRATIAAQDAARGRPLTASEKLDNLCIGLLEDNLRIGLLELGEAERLSDKDKDSIRARIHGAIEEVRSRPISVNTINRDLQTGALGALTSLLTAIEPWLAHRFDEASLPPPEEVMGAGKACADVLALLAGRPEAKDGAPRPDLRDLGRDLRAAVAPRIDALRRAVSAKDGAAPSPETEIDTPEKLAAFVLRTGEIRPLAAAPAAPSPDLAALENAACAKLADDERGWPENTGSHITDLHNQGKNDAAREIAAAIRKRLKAQPNPGPSEGRST